MHEIMGGLWWAFGWATFIFIGAQGRVDLGLSLSLNWVPALRMHLHSHLLPLVALATFHLV